MRNASAAGLVLAGPPPATLNGVSLAAPGWWLGLSNEHAWPPRSCAPAAHAGPTTAAGMAAAKGWRSSLVPALLIGIMGYATATFVGVACAAVFQRMQGLG